MKKITKKRTIDLESEFIGKPVGPIQKKERKATLTDEINAFLESPIDLENIKCILLKMSGCKKNQYIGKVSIKIYAIEGEDYLISIKGFKSLWSSKWFLCRWYLGELNGFSPSVVDKSLLKQSFKNALRRWCQENPKHVINLE